MKKQNWLVLGAAVVLIAAVAALAAFLPENRSLPQDAPALHTEAPVQTAEPAETPAATAEPAQEKAYLVVSVQGNLYEPMPLEGEGSFTIKQDEHTTNTVHVTPDSIWMEHSSCENQDCVDQGTVSLANMKDRVLYNMIICLPNEVVLELHTPETLQSVFGFVQE